MPIRTSTTGGDFELPSEGMKLARCFKVVDMGTHLDPVFGKEIHKARIFFELPKVLYKDGPQQGQPMILNQQYSLSHHKKANLRLMLENWYGKRFDTKQLNEKGGFDLTKLIGRPGLLNIVHSEDGKYANIATVNPLPEGMECPPAIYEPFVFELDDFNPVKFAKLSQKMQDFIKESGEYIKLHTDREDIRPNGRGGGGGSGFDDLEDDIPF